MHDTLPQRKHDQPTNGGSRLYVLEPVVDLLADYTKPIYFVEGEKKAAAGYQAGLGCVVGVGGIWNFLDKSNGELIPEFDRIAFNNREIYYIPDSDVWARQDLKDAIFEFGSKIRERGGLKFYFIQLPPDGKAKCGLDYFLKAHTADELLALPKVTLTGAGWKHERQAHKAREAKREKRRLGAEPEKQEEVIPKELL